jgi:hypothetical protein
MKPILFIDFDGTISTDKFWRSLPKEEYARIQGDFFKSDRGQAEDWMRGNYTAEEITEHLAEMLGYDYDELWNSFVADCK